MKDGAPKRPADSWSSIEDRSIQHTHMLTIKGFSRRMDRYLETSVRIKDSRSPESDSLSDATGGGGGGAVANAATDNANYLQFKIRLYLRGNKESNKDFCFFQLPSCTDVEFEAKFSVYNARSEEVHATVLGELLGGYVEYIHRDSLIKHIMPQDELQLQLDLTIPSDPTTKNGQNGIGPEPSTMSQEQSRLSNGGSGNGCSVVIASAVGPEPSAKRTR